MIERFRKILARDWYPPLRVLALSQTLDEERADRLLELALPRFLASAEPDTTPARLLTLAGEAVRETVRGDRVAFRPSPEVMASLPAGAAARVREKNWRLAEVFSEIAPEKRPLALLAAAARLPDRARVLLLLKYLEGLDYAAVARTVGIREEEIGPGLASARRLLERNVADLVRQAAAS